MMYRKKRDSPIYRKLRFFTGDQFFPFGQLFHLSAQIAGKHQIVEPPIGGTDHLILIAGPLYVSLVDEEDALTNT